MAQLVLTPTLLPKLASLLSAEYSLHRAARGEIMFLKVEMESMQAALIKVSQAPIDQPPDVQVKLWAKEVRDLSHDLEDSVDKFMVRIRTDGLDKAHTFMGFINRSLNLLTKAKIRHKILTDVRDIKNRVKEVSKRRETYKVDILPARPPATTTDSLRQLALYKKATELIGTEEKSNKLVEMLRKGDEASAKQLKMVSVVGFGGLGKTTLANAAYQKLKGDFDCGAFVSVSFTPNIEKIFKNLLHQLDKNWYHNINESNWGEAELITEIREYLRNKRYIIVIDDIWDKSVWEHIRCALIENEYGSRVITTTRILDVAKEDGDVYEMKPLSITDSKKLFYQIIFGKEDECPHKQLIEVSEKILMKCGGVPLAIITISSLLAERHDSAHWSKVYQSMGTGLENNPDVNGMRRILYVSYYDLPAHLKICLLYLSLYPEDCIFKRKYLIWKWVGEGFIQPKQGESLYEVGEQYFDELINRSLIQTVNSELYCGFGFSKKKASHCRVHDMVLDLITYLSQEENFMTTLGGHQYESLPVKIRRLSLHTSKQEDAKVLSTMNMSHVRSLTVFKKSFSLLPPLSSFPLLSALDLTNCKQVDDRHSMLICNMFHLRYLWLYGTYITEIPREIANLQLLQVLDFGETEIEELPSTFEQLCQLVYLRVNSWIRVPYGSKNLKSLQELKSVIVMSPSVLIELSGLTELRCLDMKVIEWNKSFEEPFHHCLSSLINLQSLKVNGCCITEDPECGNLLLPGPQQLRRFIAPYCRASSVPRWMSSLSCLSYIVISLYTLGEEDLHVLGCLPSLRHLNMDVCRHTPRQRQAWPVIGATSYPFRCLTELRYVQHAEVVFALGAMQKLQILELHLGTPDTLHQFGYFDLGLENLSSLQQITIRLSFSKDRKEEMEAAEATLRKALDMNPNKPMLNKVTQSTIGHRIF
ncbi:unnamed protein product [Triticum turgidum subsp. durum]|uniref:Uncharacterized protein n=1 Tax=Triticum turgidum subsp. durum TaxID=4567 RepID=A0A9R0TBQ6_TRITD|nr:unnamed protein product [Triticum turgidum subsp. durum]